jgi:predicted ATPase
LSRPSRVAIDGAASTGKTTLLAALACETEGWFVIEEAVRSIAASYGVRAAAQWPVVLDDPVKYRGLSERLLECQLASEQRAPFISDGSIYKIYAYARVGGVDLGADRLRRAAYDLIIYCPLEFTPVSDDFRFVEGREAVDRELRGLIREHHLGRLLEVRGRQGARLDLARRALRHDGGMP